jgi:hypothetical protein
VLEVLGTTALVTLCAAAGLILAVLACAVACFAILRLLRERPSWGSVWASYAYSTAPGVLLAVPCLGPYCGSTPVTVWFIACAIIVLVHATAIASWKVAVAALAPVVVALAAAGLVIAFAVAPAMQAAATAAAAAAPPAPAVGEGAVPETGTAEVPADADGGADAGTGADTEVAP